MAHIGVVRTCGLGVPHGRFLGGPRANFGLIEKKQNVSILLNPKCARILAKGELAYNCHPISSFSCKGL